MSHLNLFRIRLWLEKLLPKVPREQILSCWWHWYWHQCLSLQGQLCSCYLTAARSLRSEERISTSWALLNLHSSLAFAVVRSSVVYQKVETWRCQKHVPGFATVHTEKMPSLLTIKRRTHSKRFQFTNHIYKAKSVYHNLRKLSETDIIWKKISTSSVAFLLYRNNP